MECVTTASNGTALPFFIPGRNCHRSNAACAYVIQAFIRTVQHLHITNRAIAVNYCPQRHRALYVLANQFDRISGIHFVGGFRREQFSF